MRVKEPCRYMLASTIRGTIHIGVTSDLPARLHQHRNNITGGFASRYRAYRLVRHEMFETMYEAVGRGKQLKRWHRQWKIKLVESQNPTWQDLAPLLGIAEPLSPGI